MKHGSYRNRPYNTRHRPSHYNRISDTMAWWPLNASHIPSLCHNLYWWSSADNFWRWTCQALKINNTCLTDCTKNQLIYGFNYSASSVIILITFALTYVNMTNTAIQYTVGFLLKYSQKGSILYRLKSWLTGKYSARKYLERK